MSPSRDAAYFPAPEPSSQELKRAAIVSSGLQAQRDEAAAQDKRESRCFWTRPLGHHYQENVCVSCGKRREISW